MKKITKNFWKVMLSLSLLVSLILPATSLANTKANALHNPVSLVTNKDAVLDQYSQLAAKYLGDCQVPNCIPG